MQLLGKKGVLTDLAQTPSFLTQKSLVAAVQNTLIKVTKIHL